MLKTSKLNKLNLGNSSKKKVKTNNSRPLSLTVLCKSKTSPKWFPKEKINKKVNLLKSLMKTTYIELYRLRKNQSQQEEYFRNSMMTGQLEVS